MANPVELAENETDLQAFEERAAEKTIPFDEFLALLKEAGTV